MDGDTLRWDGLYAELPPNHDGTTAAVLELYHLAKARKSAKKVRKRAAMQDLRPGAQDLPPAKPEALRTFVAALRQAAADGASAAEVEAMSDELLLQRVRRAGHHRHHVFGAGPPMV